MTNNTQSESVDSSFDLRKIINLFWRYWYIALLFPLLGLALGYTYTRYMVPIYKTTGTIMIRSDDPNKGSHSNSNIDPTSLFRANASNVVDEIDILKSRSLMTIILRELNLNPSYTNHGRIKRSEHFNTAPIKVDSFVLSTTAFKNGISLRINIVDKFKFEIVKDETKISAQFDVPFVYDSCFFRIKYTDMRVKGTYTISFDNIERMANNVISRMKISVINTEAWVSNGIMITMEDAIPERAEAIINKLVEVYNLSGVEDKSRADQNALRFIDERIQLLERELSGVERNIESYKKKEGITADVATDLPFLYNKLGESDTKVADLEIRKAVFKALSESITKQTNTNTFELMPGNLTDNNTSITGQIVEYNRLILEHERLLQYARKENPLVVALEKQLHDWQNNIRTNIDNNLNKISQEINLSLDKFRSSNASVTKQLHSIPERQRELTEIGRLKGIKESIYLFLLQRREETALSLATTVPSARVLDPAMSSLLPVKPDKRQVVISSFLIGLIMAALIIYVLFLLKSTVENEDDIRAQTSTPFLGYVTIGESNKQIVVDKGSRTSTAETFRLLRSNVQFMLAVSENKIVMITSSMTGEGKSFITLNMGVSLALTNKKTVIVGFDLRKPKLTSYLQNTSDKTDNQGLTNYLVGDISVEKIIHQSDVNPFLYYISSGPIPPNPAELIMQERTDKLFEYLRTEFDFIIVDTPPVGMVVDALILSKYAATTVYVTRFGVTQKNQLRLIDALRKEGKLPNPSIVLNAVKSSRAYGYSYTYGYSSDDGIKKKMWGQRLKELFTKKKQE